jgi:predicted secreted Zn-dependent protease
LFRFVAVVLFSAVVMFQGLPEAQAKIVIREKITYYPVRGRTGIDLGRAMVKSGPKAVHMRHAIAATATKFDFTDAKLAVENGRCVVKDVTVKLTLTYYYPKWHRQSGTSTGLRRAWKAFYGELVRHEKTHGRIAKKYASRLEKELKNMSGTVAFGCRDFGRWSLMRMKAMAAQLKIEQAAFDTREDSKSSKITRLQVVLLKSK